MTTQREVNRLVKPLLERNSDLFQMKRLLHIKPVHHMLRAVGIEPVNRKMKFGVVWRVCPLCSPISVFPMLYAGELYAPMGGRWTTTAPDISINLIKQVEDVALPIIRGVKTIDDFCNLDFPRSILFWSWRRDRTLKPFVDAACGRFDEAEESCREIESQEREWRAADGLKDFNNIAKVLLPLVANRDLKGLADQLRAWEAYTARNLGIEKYWEPTPFPFEEQQ